MVLAICAIAGWAYVPQAHACQGVKDEICLAVVLYCLIESASKDEDDDQKSLDEDTDEENGDDTMTIMTMFTTMMIE